MLLRSSSTPILGSLISSISESPNHHHHHHYQPEVQPHTANKPPVPSIPHHFHKKLSFHQSPSQSFTTFSCNSSPISSVADFSGGCQTGFRRAQSEGNLESLANTSSQVDEFSLWKPRMKFANSSLLQTIPKGLGVTGVIDKSYSTGGGGGGSGGANVGYGGDSGGSDGGKSIEEYYKKMVEENPGNPLFLRNYAQFLYQAKGDLERAEEYYSRAILADSDDGEILSQYASLIWELHHDEDRALSYFERAVRVASQDSHVHAAYANFLWQIEDDDDDDEEDEDLNHQHAVNPLLRTGAMASASA